MIIWLKPNDLVRAKCLFGAPNDYLAQAKCAPNAYLVQAKRFCSRQMIIWLKPNDLVRAKSN